MKKLSVSDHVHNSLSQLGSIPDKDSHFSPPSPNWFLEAFNILPNAYGGKAARTIYS